MKDRRKELAAACIAAGLSLAMMIAVRAIECRTVSEIPEETEAPAAAAPVVVQIAETPAPVIEQPKEQPEVVEQVETETPATMLDGPLLSDKIALAQMVWGEAGNCTKTEQAAVVWCALNRFDSEDPYFTGCETIEEIVAQPSQFHGYSPKNPVEEDILALVEDVLIRWGAEKCGEENVGRVLPAEYLFFHGDGLHNHFKTEYRGGTKWDWSLQSPYEE